MDTNKGNIDSKKLESCVRRLYDEVYTKGNTRLIDELVTSNLKFHDSAVADTKNGLEAFKDSENTYHKAFPGKKAMIDDLIISNNKVVVRWTCTGKQDGTFQGNAPTHRTFSLSGVSIYLFTNDKITEVWQAWNALSLYDQIGITPPTHAMHR